MRRRLPIALLILVLPACASRTLIVSEPLAPSRDIAAPLQTVAPATATLGVSRSARSISATTYADGETRVYLIAAIHGDEAEGRSALETIRDHLASGTGGATVRLVDDMNPDGSAKGSRTNAAGVDLNRNWPAANFRKGGGRGPAPLSEPETAVVYDDITRFDPHLIIVLHSARAGPFVNYDGPPAAGALADRFAAAARSAGDTRWRAVGDMGYPTPGSMGSYFGNDRGLPILTVELRRGEAPEKIPAPLIAGLAGVLADRSVALRPLSRVAPSVRLASEASATRATTAPPAQ